MEDGEGRMDEGDGRTEDGEGRMEDGEGRIEEGDGTWEWLDDGDISWGEDAASIGEAAGGG